jgi:hypothetical protein
VAVVRTNATAYDDSGTALYRLTAALPAGGGEGSPAESFTASASAFGLLQPAAGASPPPPVVIPLPPAAVPAAMTLAGIGVAGRLRRRRPR